ncbi:MAG: hypothetical protein ACLTS1_00755 [Coprococcus sp.]
MVLIAINKEKSLSSASIAESVHTNPGFVRQLMLKLKKSRTYDQCRRTCPSLSFKTSRPNHIAGCL